MTMTTRQSRKIITIYFIAIVLLCILENSDAHDSLRGKMEILKDRVLHHPSSLPEEYRAKTLQELGFSMMKTTQERKERRLQSTLALGEPSHSYIALYEEFGPALTALGDTAGVRGTIFNTDAKVNGLKEEYVEGAMDGTCSSVASNGTLLCTYEIFLLDSSSGFMATLVATGSVSLELFKPNLLLIEATGDDFRYKNGLLTLTYTAGGAKPIVEIDIIV